MGHAPGQYISRMLINLGRIMLLLPIDKRFPRLGTGPAAISEILTPVILSETCLALGRDRCSRRIPIVANCDRGLATCSHFPAVIQRKFPTAASGWKLSRDLSTPQEIPYNFPLRSGRQS